MRLVSVGGVGVVQIAPQSDRRKSLYLYPAAFPVLAAPSVLVPSATSGVFIDPTSPPLRVEGEVAMHPWSAYFTGACSMLLVEEF